MKKVTIITTVALLISAGTYLAFAEEQTGGMMGKGMHSSGMMDSNSMMMQKGMMGKQGEGMMGGGMMGQQGMMGKGMMGQQGMTGMHTMSGMMGGSSMVATQDGGIIVLIGNKLLKYDKDLNLVKEVEIKIDWESLNKTMMQHRKMMMSGQSE